MKRAGVPKTPEGFDRGFLHLAVARSEVSDGSGELVGGRRGRILREQTQKETLR
jgi:hypothetical protein